jgi:two-component system, NtrC family, nitrogen regulation sensor histidine kinase GlnL
MTELSIGAAMGRLADGSIPTSAVLLISIALLNIAIGVSVYRRNRLAPLNRSFACTALAVGLWTAALAWGRLQPSSFDLAIRTAFSAGSLIPLGVIFFVEHFGSPSRTRALRLKLMALAAVTFSLLSFSPWMVSDVTREGYGMRPLYGVLHPFFASYLIVSFGLAALTLVAKYRHCTGLQKTQGGHLFLAFILPGLLATTTNVLVPLVAGTSAYNGLGPVFSLIMIAMVAHAIIRHRLMDIRIVIRRGVVYLVTFLSSAAIFVLLLAGSNAVLPQEQGFSLRDVLFALIVAVLFQSVKLRVQGVFDRYLYRDPYDYARTLRDASSALTATIDLPALLEHVGSVLTKTLRPEGMSIYLFEDEGRLFVPAWTSGVLSPQAEMSTGSPLLAALMADHRMLFRDEVGGRASSDCQPRVSLEMEDLHAEVVVPLIEQSEVIGVLVLGAKRSGDPYFSNDVDLLTTLANQAAVAVRNAQTHARVVHMNEQLNKVLETIESGVVAVGPRGRITLFNRAAEQLTGTSTKLAHGQSPESLPAPLAELLQATAADGQPRANVEFSLPGLAGHVVPLICSTLPLRGPGGATLGAVAVLNDISRLKELEQEKRRVERLTSIEAIASGLIHEIRNPLVGIKTYAQLLPSRGASEEFRDMFSRTAGREIGRIDELLSRFRTISLAAQQPMQAVDISGPLRDTFETLHAEMQDRQIRLRQVGDVAHRPVLGNASQLQQLFLNLCLNAIQAMEPGGELTVRVADLSEGGGNTLIVEVADTGPGIPEELLATIFDAFVTTKPHGTGLGLAICRGIADAHHARLAARNNVGRPGCTFTVEFPVPSGRPTRIAP